MLNTITLWDRPPVSDERGGDGRLLHKAGIRPDWTRTRSAFCYRDTAAAAMRDVVRAADCRWLAVSYSNEGLIGLEELCDLLAETGELTVQSRDYAKYPGGKQSLHRATRNVELVLVVRRGPGTGTPARVREALLKVRLSRLLALSFDPARIRRRFAVLGDSIIAGDGQEVRLPMRHFWRFLPGVPLPRFSTDSAAASFLEALSECAASDIGEEIEILVSLAGELEDAREKDRMLRASLRLLGKLAHRKYAAEFTAALGMLHAAAPRLRAGAAFLEGLDAAAEKAARRLVSRSTR
jgi:adenine-specific DNA-methyltransferase